MNIEALGITAEELREQIVERAATKLTAEVLDGYMDDVVSPIQRAVTEHQQAAIDKAVAEIVTPYFQQEVEKLVFEETNRWGEKVGKKMTFREMVIQRAEAYITEPVSHDGKTKAEDSYNWRPNTTRIAYTIDKHLQYHISTVMKDALTAANAKIAEGIEGAVRIQLKQLVEGLKVSASVK